MQVASQDWTQHCQPSMNYKVSIHLHYNVSYYRYTVKIFSNKNAKFILVEHDAFFANYDKKPRKTSFRNRRLAAVSKDAELNFKFLLGIYSLSSMCVTTFELFNRFFYTVVRVLKVISSLLGSKISPVGVFPCLPLSSLN